MEIYTDGACSGNPGPGAYAIVIIKNKSIEIISRYEENTTNNRMELSAVINAIEYLKEKKESATIFTDSNYVYLAIHNNKVEKWIKTKHAKNLDLWEKYYSIANDVDFKIEKVEGHKNNFGNNLADKIAKYTIKVFSKKI